MTRTVKLLFCNVGSSDLDRALLEELNRLNERERAQRILAAWETYAPRLRLPIIGKALRYVLNQPGDLARLVLIASDQGDTPPDDPYLAELWGKDTCGTAQVIRRALAAGCDGLPALDAERIDIWTIADRHGRERDPSDYDGVRRFFERRMPDMARAFPTATVYLEVTGGTPAMTTGLLVAGSEVWGARATALYVHPRYALPQTLNTTTRLLAAPLRAALRANASTFDYDAALRLLRDHRSAIADRLIPGADQVLEAVLDHARCRFNFDLRGARRALEGGVDRLGDGRWRADLIALYEAVTAPDRAARLAEVYHGAAARYAVGAYSDFLAQVSRFQENAWRLLCLERGAQFIDRFGQPNDDGFRVSRAWEESVEFRFRYDSPGESGDRPVNRSRLRALARHLAQRRGEDIRRIVDALDRLNGLADLRNEVVHTLEGVARSDLARAFAGSASDEQAADRIVPHMADVYAALVGRPPGASPYATINTLIEILLREAEQP
jgi:hypothetical protein